jgi:hypothetical protein
MEDNPNNYKSENKLHSPSLVQDRFKLFGKYIYIKQRKKYFLINKYISSLVLQTYLSSILAGDRKHNKLVYRL